MLKLVQEIMLTKGGSFAGNTLPKKARIFVKVRVLNHKP